jgi:hypothetical protein
MTTEAVILCEGYHDRDFWAGWLEYLQLQPPDRIPGTAGAKPVEDPWGKPIPKGQFCYSTSLGQFIRIVPCGGDARVVKEVADGWLNPAMQQYQAGARELALRRLLFCVDSDARIDEKGSVGQFGISEFISWLWKYDPNPEPIGNGEVSLFGRATTALLIHWETADKENIAGIPNQQTLERLVCSAIVAAYPERAKPIQKWLDSRPEAPVAGPKEFAWSHMAGWYAEFGSNAFYRKLWRDDRLVEQLRMRLEAIGAWAIVENLAK